MCLETLVTLVACGSVIWIASCAHLIVVIVACAQDDKFGPEGLLLGAVDSDLDPPFLLVRTPVKAFNRVVELDMLVDAMSRCHLIQIAQD